MFLMHGLRENDFGRFYWLTEPLKRKAEFHEFYEPSPLMDQLTPVVRSQIKCCEHARSCDEYIWNVCYSTENSDAKILNDFLLLFRFRSLKKNREFADSSNSDFV